MKFKLIAAAVLLVSTASFFANQSKAYVSPTACEGGCCYNYTGSTGNTYALCKVSAGGDECSTVKCCDAL